MHGQCYNGASAVSGSRNGVAKRGSNNSSKIVFSSSWMPSAYAQSCSCYASDSSWMPSASRSQNAQNAMHQILVTCQVLQGPRMHRVVHAISGSEVGGDSEHKTCETLRFMAHRLEGDSEHKTCETLRFMAH